MLNILFYLCVFALSLGQFSSITSFGSGKLYLFDLLIPLFNVFGLIYFLSKHEFSLPKNSKPFILFSVIAFFSLVVKIELLDLIDLIAAGFYLFRFINYLVAGIVVYNMLVQKLLALKQLVYTFMLSALFVAIAGFVQLVIMPDLGVLDLSHGWDPHKKRLVSTFFDPNYVGCYLGLILGLVLFVNLPKTLLTKAAYLVILLAFFLTYSRSAYGLLGMLIFIYGLFKSPKTLLLAVMLAFVAFFAVPRIQTRLAGLTDPADSARFRLISWSNTIEIIKDNFWFGVGFNAYKNAQIEYGFANAYTENDHSLTGADSSLLFVFATTGVFGFLVFLLGFFYPLLQKNLYIIAMVLGLFLQSQFINALFYPQIMFFWLVLINSTQLFSDSLQK